jgi:hypothetical protein
MKENPMKEGVMTVNSVAIGTVTRKDVRERAALLAAIDGRASHETTKSDWVEAKRQLTGDPSVDPDEAVIDATPESERWETVPDSSGHKVPVAQGEDEDGEGRSDQENLVMEGMAGAELDHSRAASEAGSEDAADATGRLP